MPTGDGKAGDERAGNRDADADQATPSPCESGNECKQGQGSESDIRRQRQERLILPCLHESIVLTDDLDHYERLKLFLLNGGHTFLAERWKNDGRPADEIVPVFDSLGQRDAALSYLVELRERLLNPFLVHRLAEIAQNHAQKRQRRFAPVVAMAEARGLNLAQPRLRAALSTPD